MTKAAISIYKKLAKTIDSLDTFSISPERKQILHELINYIDTKLKQDEIVYLNFICTHNSRRSQFSQVWAQTAADYYDLEVDCFSGGVEVTAFNEKAVESIRRSGFQVTKKGKDNPVYFIFHSDEGEPISAFSKLYDDPINPPSGYAAIMTCTHADENCPFTPGAEKRISLPYEDPKAYDNTPQASAQYDARSLQIAAEMFYVFSKIKL